MNRPSPTQSTEVPEEAVEAAANAIETRCCSFGDGDGSLGKGWARSEYLRVANEVVQAVAPVIRNQEHQRLYADLRERVGAAIDDASCECDPGYSTYKCLVCRIRSAMKGDEDA